MDASVGDRIVIESERAAQSGQTGVIEEVLGAGSAALPRPLGRRPHKHLRSLGRCREHRAAQERARKGLTGADAAQHRLAWTADYSWILFRESK